MLLLTYTASTILIFCFVINTHAAQAQYLQDKKIFYNKEVIVDYRPIKNNSLIFAVCEVGIYRLDLKCSIILETFNATDIVANKTCNVILKSEGPDRRIGNHFQLIQLDSERFIFSYTDESMIKEPGPTEYLIKFRVIRTTLCQKSVETRISLYHLKHHPRPTAHFVPYTDTFDVFYDYKILKGPVLWGQTHDTDGKIVNGPVPSFLPSAIFATGSSRQPRVYPAKPGSSLMGHFVISYDKLVLVSSWHGVVLELVNHRDRVYTYSPPRIGSEYFSTCTVLKSAQNYVNCTTFDPHGNGIMNSVISFKSKIIGLVAMHNLADGAFLLLARQCKPGKFVCANTSGQVSHYVVKVHRDGHVDEPQEIWGIDCDELRDDQLEFSLAGAGEVCLNFACHSGPDKRRLTFFNLEYRCAEAFKDKLLTVRGS